MTHHLNTNKKLIKKLWGWITGLIAIVVAAFGFNYLFAFNAANYSDDAEVQQLLSPVNARVGGYIRNVEFQEFQQVKKGDTLLIIDNTDYLVQQQLAEANLLDAQAGKNVTHSSVSTAENSINTATANIEETKARLWNARKNLSRYEMLLKQESVTEQQYDQVKSDYDALDAKLISFQSTATGSRLSVQETGAKLGVNEAAVKSYRDKVYLVSVRHVFLYKFSNGVNQIANDILLVKNGSSLMSGDRKRFENDEAKIRNS